jgi:hypothetical protein
LAAQIAFHRLYRGRQGKESRLTARLPENLQQVLSVPGGAFSPSFDGSVIGELAHQIESEVSDQNENCWTCCTQLAISSNVV